MSDHTDPSGIRFAPPRPGRAAWLIVAVIVAAYAATLAVLPRSGLWINDNGCKFIQLQGLIRSNYRDFSIALPGKDLDPSFAFNPLPAPLAHVVDGALYCQYSPVFALVSTIPYRLFGWIGLYLLPVVAGLLTLPAVWGLAGFLPGRRTARLLALVITALATPLWFYSVTFWEHTPAVCLTTWSVLLSVRAVVHQRRRDLAVAAVLAGLAVYFRDELYLFGVVLAAANAWSGRQRWTDFGLFLLVFALALIPLWCFQGVALGHPLGHHFATYSPFEGGLWPFLVARWTVVRNLLINSHGSLWVSVLVAAPFLIGWLLRPSVSRATPGWVGPMAVGLAGVAGLVTLGGHVSADAPVWYLRRANSLFTVAPILILAFVRTRVPGCHCSRAVPRGTHAKDDGGRVGQMLWLIVLLYVLAYALIVPVANTTGLHWGCRFLLSAYPLLAVPAASTLATWWESHAPRARTGRVILAALLALSVAAQVHGLSLLYQRKAFTARLNQTVAGYPHEIVLTSSWFVPADLYGSFFDKKIFLVSGPRGTDQVLGAAYRAGYCRALWVQRVDPRQPLSPDAELLTDEPLNFISLGLQPIRLSD